MKFVCIMTAGLWAFSRKYKYRAFACALNVALTPTKHIQNALKRIHAMENNTLSRYM